MVKFYESLEAKILIFHLVNFDLFFVKNDYLSSEKKKNSLNSKSRKNDLF